MIKNEDTYCIVQHKIVRELGSWEAVVYGTIANLLRKTDGIGEVSNQTIMDMCGIKRASFFRYISTLIESGYIEKRSGDGRGNISIYHITKKGLNLIPFSNKKGSQNETERVSKMNEKGLNLIPINKELNKELKEREETPTPKKVVMEDFEKWWNLFPGDPDFSYDKENCERVWFGMPAEWKSKLVEMAEHGTRWRNRNNDKPIFYLRDYQGQDEQVELPYWRQGTAEHTKRLNEADANGETIIIMRYDGHLAFCLEKDRDRMEAAGAEFVTVREKRKCE